MHKIVLKHSQVSLPITLKSNHPETHQALVGKYHEHNMSHFTHYEDCFILQSQSQRVKQYLSA